MSFSMRTIATLAVAAVLGLVAVLMARSYLSSARGPLAPAAPTGTVAVVVAAKPIERGVDLQPSLLKVVKFPADAAPAGAFGSLDAFAGPQGQNRLALRSMVTNEPILPTNVSGPGGKLNLSTVVAAGMRAVSMQGGDVVGVGGFVLPGDRVDILVTRSEGSGPNNQITQVIAEDLLVLGIDQSANQEADKPVVARAVTVQATPEQAQAITLAHSVGTVSLMLRHVADDTPLTQTLTTVADLGGTQQPHHQFRRGSGGGVRVVRGVSSSHFSFAGVHN